VRIAAALFDSCPLLGKKQRVITASKKEVFEADRTSVHKRKSEG